MTAQLPTAERTDDGVLRRLGADSAYLLTGVPVAIVSFTAMVAGVSLAAGLLVTVVGIPVAAGTLAVAVALGRLERGRLAARGTYLDPVHLTPVRGSGLRGQLDRLADPRRWAAVVHGVGALPLAVLTWSLTLTWWAVTLGGLTYWLWAPWLPNPESNVTLVELLDLPVSESVLYVLLGAAFAATLPAVLRGLVGLHAGWARALLTGSSRRALSREVADLTSRRTAAAQAEAHSLRRLERDLHDGPQQRLVRLGMDLAAAERRLTDDPEQTRALLAAAREQAAETLAELRALSRGVAPPILVDRGLEAALTAVAARSTVPVSVDVRLTAGERPPQAVESAAYFVACEALANVAKHAEAHVAAVHVDEVTSEGRRALRVQVVDDGRGGAHLAKGHGLAGLAARVEGLGGRLDVVSPEGGPTTCSAVLAWD